MQTKSDIFPPTTGGAEKMAVDMGIPFLGRLPLDPRIGRWVAITRVSVVTIHLHCLPQAVITFLPYRQVL